MNWAKWVACSSRNQRVWIWNKSSIEFSCFFLSYIRQILEWYFELKVVCYTHSFFKSCCKKEAASTDGLKLLMLHNISNKNFILVV